MSANTMRPNAVPIILDCDPGIDDAMAILYGLKAPEIDIVAIGTVWGNVDVVTTTSNALRLLEIGEHPSIPVAPGAARPLLGPPPSFGGIIHGSDGFGNTNLPLSSLQPSAETASEQIVRLASERPGELTLVAVGPLTNLAIALWRDPTIAEKIPRVVVMGGAFLVPGNARRMAEANIWHDPEAAQIVLDAPWSVTLVGLDVTEKVRVQQTMLDKLRDSGTAAGVFLHRISDVYLSAYEPRYGRREAPPHDALALGIAVDPSLVTRSNRLRVDIELVGQHTRGMTVADLRSWIYHDDTNADVIFDIDADRFLTQWLRVMSDGKIS